MHGNVWEWCQSAWKGYPYDADDGRELALPRKPDAKKDPKSLVDTKAIRGGSWHHSPVAATSYGRACSIPTDHRYYYGCRVAMNVTK